MSIKNVNSARKVVHRVWSRIAHIVNCPLSSVVVLLYACETWCLFCVYSNKDISCTRTQFGTTETVLKNAGAKRRNNFLSEPVWPQVSRVSSYRCRETIRFNSDQRIVEKSSYVGSLLSAMFAGWKAEEL
jgi:hypothetical protein